MRDSTGYYSRGGGGSNARGGGGGHSGSGYRGGRGRGRGGGQNNHSNQHQSSNDDRKEKRKRDAIFDIKKYNDKQIRVKFMGGREVTGILKGSDQLLNIVLDEAEETLQNTGESGKRETKRHIGLVVLRGPSIILVSPTDGSEEIENPFVQAEE